jgi:beta-glucosidase
LEKLPVETLCKLKSHISGPLPYNYLLIHSQIYIRDLVSRLDRPTKELKGFAKTALLEPGKTGTVTVTLDKYAFAYFDDWAGEGKDGEGLWVAEAGEFEIVAAGSSADAGLLTGISLKESFDWL